MFFYKSFNFLRSAVILIILIFGILVQPINSQDLYNFNHGGISRQYYLYKPQSLPLGSPLVFVFHGYGSNALNIMSYSGMNSVADTNLFAVCYPQGTYDDYGSQFWNVGYEFHSDEIDDLDFVLALSQYLTSEHHFSRNNIFSTGMSNGGDFSYLLACEASNVFQAIAPVAGTMMGWIYESCDPNEPLSVLEIHGTDDSITLWEGDLDNSEGWGPYLDVPSIIDFWQTENECQSFIVDTLENSNQSDGSFIISETFYNCIYDNEVKLYKIINGGHDWPGAYGNMDIHSAEEIWVFLEQNLQVEFIGDVNFDSFIDILDLLKISDYLLSGNPYYYLYDFDENYSLSGLDIISIIDYILRN